jgi:hypothetical protein
LTKLVVILLEEPFLKLGLDFIGPLNLQANYQAIGTFWWSLIMQPNGLKHKHSTPTLQ